MVKHPLLCLVFGAVTLVPLIALYFLLWRVGDLIDWLKRHAGLAVVAMLLTACAGPQRHLDDDRNMATMPFDKLIVELAK